MQNELQQKNKDDSKVAEGESQAQYAHRLIEEMIVTLALPPGSRISEQSLSAQLGIGRTPVREALQRLAYERTIKILPRSGIIVSEIDLAAHFKLIELRREVERILVSRAARLAEPMDCRKFAELVERFEAAEKSNDAAQFISADAEFNELLAEVADNSYAASAMAPLQAQTRRIWYLNYQAFGDVSTVSRLHADIAGAVSRKDEKKASEALDALIDYVENYTYRTMDILKKSPPLATKVRGGKAAG
jgi:DNA-binding GntR family transcriptional regulator